MKSPLEYMRELIRLLEKARDNDIKVNEHTWRYSPTGEATVMAEIKTAVEIYEMWLEREERVDEETYSNGLSEKDWENEVRRELKQTIKEGREAL